MAQLGFIMMDLSKRATGVSPRLTICLMFTLCSPIQLYPTTDTSANHIYSTKLYRSQSIRTPVLEEMIGPGHVAICFELLWGELCIETNANPG